MPNLLLRRRLALFAAALVAIVAGTTLRLVPVGLPAGLVKYGGSVIWGAMVYCLVATVMASARTARVVTVSLGLALASELFRLVTRPGSTRCA